MKGMVSEGDEEQNKEGMMMQKREVIIKKERMSNKMDE